MTELLTRGVERIYPSPEKLEQVLATGRKLRIYWGVDPTGSSLHIGHAANLLKLKDFQDQGHEIILLIGDFTARIGDPTDKTATRVQLSPAEVAENMKHYLDQAGKILDLTRVQVRYNSEWLAKLSFAELLELTSRVTFAQIVKRDMFQKRLAENKDLFLHEFLYPLMQGYDSVALDVDMEVGGNDQIFNMLVGRDLLKSFKQKEKFVLATKLLTDPTGAKMGKTSGNMVTLNAAPGEMYGQVMSWPDSLLLLGFEICTRLPLEENLALAAADPKQAKMKLARAIVTVHHGAEAAAAAEQQFVAQLQNQEIPTDLPVFQASLGEPLADFLVKNKIIASKTEFRRLLTAGAICNLETNEKLTEENNQIKTPLTLKIGKRRLIKIRL